MFVWRSDGKLLATARRYWRAEVLEARARSLGIPTLTSWTGQNDTIEGASLTCTHMQPRFITRLKSSSPTVTREAGG